MIMKWFPVISVILAGLFIPVGIFGQTPLAFSLKQAHEYAYEHNFTLKNAQNDIEIARKTVKENTAIGLPQISAHIDYLDYIKMPTMLLPGEFFGSPGEQIPVQFGTKYNMTFEATLTQLIYSGQYLVGLQTAKAYQETVKQKAVKDKMDVRDLVSETYIGYLVLDESISILDSAYIVVAAMVEEAKQSYQRGFLEEMDVEQARLNLDNLDAIIKDLKIRRLISMSWLKFAMGLEETQEVILTDNLGFFLTQIDQDYLMNSSFDYNTNINYLILKKQEYLSTMQYKLSKTAYHPTLAGFLGLSENAQRNDWSFVNFSGEKQWYEVVNWGVSLSIPIWSSGSRKFSVDKAKLNLDKVKVVEEQLKKSLNIEVKTARADFGNSYLLYLNKRQSLETSRKIYQQTVIKYRKGVASSTDLNQKYNQFLQVESDYTQSLLNLLKNKIRLSKILEKS